MITVKNIYRVTWARTGPSSNAEWHFNAMESSNPVRVLRKAERVAAGIKTDKGGFVAICINPGLNNSKDLVSQYALGKWSDLEIEKDKARKLLGL